MRNGWFRVSVMAVAAQLICCSPTDHSDGLQKGTGTTPDEPSSPDPSTTEDVSPSGTDGPTTTDPSSGTGDVEAGCKVKELHAGLCNCVIKQDGTLWCWGVENCIANDREDGDELAQIVVPGGVLTMDETSSGQTLAVSAAGELFYWGEPEPDVITAARTIAGTEREPIRFPNTPAGIRDVAIAGKDFLCVLRGDSDVSCWDEDVDAWQNVVLGDGSRLTKLAAGWYTVCGLDEAGAVHCITPHLTSCGSVPLDLSGEEVVSLGRDCAVTRTGAAYCGLFAPPAGTDCTAVPELQPEVLATDVATAVFNQCFVTLEGGVRCQGSGSEGDLGNGAFIDRTTFVDVDLWAGKAKRVTLGITPCAVLENDRLWCWGSGLPEPLSTTTAVPTMIPLCANDVAPTPPAPVPLDDFVDVTGTPAGAVELTGASASCDGLDVGTIVYRHDTGSPDFGVCSPTGPLANSGYITGIYEAPLYAGMFEYVDEAYLPPAGREKSYGAVLWSRGSGINQTTCLSDDGALSGGRSALNLEEGDEACGSRAIVLSVSPPRIRLNFTHRRFAEIELQPVPGADTITMP